MSWIKQVFSLWGIYALTYDLVLRFAPYRVMMQEITRILRQNGAASVLDLGCGTGNLGFLIHGAGSSTEIEGLDSSLVMLARARKKNPQSHYVEANLNDRLPYPDRKFSAVVSINSLYAVADPDKVVREMKRVLEPGGLLIISTPKMGSTNLDLIKEHYQLKGWLSTLFLLISSLLSLLVNLAIDFRARKGVYHLFSEDEIRELVGEKAEILSTFAGTDWLVLWRK